MPSSAATPLADDVIESVTRLLHDRGDRMTAPRRAVLAVLARAASSPGDEHLAADQVVARVAEADASVHRVSVYRALEALTGLGVVQHVHLGHGGTAYHLVAADAEHLHAQCRSCGAVIDVPAGLLDAAARRLEASTGFALDTGHVALSGWCAACRDADRAPEVPPDAGRE